MAIRAFLGRRGQGKTTLAYFVARQSAYRMIFDPRGLIRTADSVIEETLDGIRDGAQDLIDGRITELVVTPRGNVETAFAAFCKAAAVVVRAHPHRPLAILIDEVRFIDTKNESLDWIMRTSNIKMVHVLFTGHRPKDIPPDIRAIADSWHLFQFTLPRDLDVIEEQTSPDVARAVQRLQPRCFVEWDDATGKAEYFSNPAQWYVVLSDHRVEDAAMPDAKRLEPDPPKPRSTLWD